MTESAPPQATEAAPATHKKPMSAVWIPATLSVGLLLAAIYLGGRIVTANSHASAHAIAKPIPAPVKTDPVQTRVVQAAPVQVAAAPAPPLLPTPKTEPATPKPEPATPKPEPALSRQDAADQQVQMIDPRAGERYIQVGALDLELTKRYIPRLRAAKFEPHVAAGPSPNLLRILIGPFQDRDALNSTKTELDRGGFANFVRVY
jgi:cell division septation protein DedD